MRHCPECRQPFGPLLDVCPECWTALAAGPPPDRSRLSLLFESEAFFQADLLEAALRDEGIPCLRVPNQLPWFLAGYSATAGVRLFVRTEMLAAAREIAIDVFGRTRERFAVRGDTEV